MGFDLGSNMIHAGSVSKHELLTLDFNSVSQIIEVIKGVYGYQFDLRFPKRKIYRSHGNSYNEGLGTAAISFGSGGGYEKIYFGNIYSSLFVDATDEHLVQCYFANSVFLKNSGKCNSGYTGLVNLPFENKNVIFNRVEMIQTVSTNKSWFMFDGWEFEIK